MLWRLKEFTRSLINLCRWFPILWRDRDWDYDYLLILMERKLLYMSQHMERYSVHTNQHVCVQKMRLCSKLLRKVREGEYLYETAGFHEMVFTDGSISIKDIGDPKGYIDSHPTESRSLPLDMPVYTKATHIACMRHTKAKRILFRLMEQNIETWWS